MKTITKAVSALLCAVMLLALLAACGGGSDTKDVPVSDLSAAVGKAIGKADAMMELDTNFLGLTKRSATDLGEHVILINAMGANVDEYGIFKAVDGSLSAKELKETVDTYLSRRLDAWMEEYMPEEKPKLTQAVVETCGRYVIYLIVAEDVRQNMLDAFRAALKAG